MTKSSVPAKSRGVLLFAFNTEKTDYVRIAERAARLVQHTLNLPVTLVTEQDIESEHFDTVIYLDNTLKNFKVGEQGSWRNGDRWRAYELSPYDETLLIDTDYLMLDRNLLTLFEQDFDYRIMSWNNKPSQPWALKMGMFGHDYLWATAVLFRKTPKAKMLFDLVGRIQRNYLYYMKLYHMREGNFRNDYAFTIANNILNGYDLNFDQGIVTPMLTFADVTTSITTKGSMLVVKERERAYVIPRQNIHIMDKGYLLSDNFAAFVDLICAE
jgi:hypothetical protein